MFERLPSGIGVVEKEKEFMSANIMKVVVKSTGPRGGDAGHGSRHYVSFEDRGGTAWEVRVDGSPLIRNPIKVEFVFGGDTELENLIGSLQFAADSLREAAKMRVPKA